MQEYSSISVSSYEAGSLADRLTEQSNDGWTVVAIVPTGSTITAYLSRSADEPAAATIADDVPPAEEPAVEEPAVEEPAADEPAEPALPASDPIVPAAVGAEVGADAQAGLADASEEISPSPASADTASSAVADTAVSAATSQAGAAPAGWYADPSSRFELRYWDGGQWTEHVSRAGQQYTDPPVA